MQQYTLFWMYQYLYLYLYAIRNYIFSLNLELLVKLIFKLFSEISVLKIMIRETYKLTIF